jgi:hypothetical protein
MIAMAIICCVGILIVAGIIVGQISAFGIVFLVVALPLFAYVSGWKIEAFGNTFRVGEIVVLLTGGFVTPMGRPVGETEALQRLADCEARILKLREVRP